MEIAYVGSATDGGYADLNVNYGEPGGGQAARKYFAVAGNTTINDWAGRTKSRYKALQLALNRPFRNGLMLKGAYTLSEAKDTTTNGEDGWVGLNWNHPMQYDDNFRLAIFDRTHVAQLGVLYELPFFKGSEGALKSILGGWQVNTIAAWYTGTPFGVTGTNTPMNCQGCGDILQEAKDIGYQLIRLDSARFMKEAHQLYRSTGFKVITAYEGSEYPRNFRNIGYSWGWFLGPGTRHK